MILTRIGDYLLKHYAFSFFWKRLFVCLSITALGWMTKGYSTASLSDPLQDQQTLGDRYRHFALTTVSGQAEEIRALLSQNALPKVSDAQKKSLSIAIRHDDLVHRARAQNLEWNELAWLDQERALYEREIYIIYETLPAHYRRCPILLGLSSCPEDRERREKIRIYQRHIEELERRRVAETLKQSSLIGNQSQGSWAFNRRSYEDDLLIASERSLIPHIIAERFLTLEMLQSLQLSRWEGETRLQSLQRSAQSLIFNTGRDLFWEAFSGINIGDLQKHLSLSVHYLGKLNTSFASNNDEITQKIQHLYRTLERLNTDLNSVDLNGVAGLCFGRPLSFNDFAQKCNLFWKVCQKIQERSSSLQSLQVQVDFFYILNELLESSRHYRSDLLSPYAFNREYAYQVRDYPYKGFQDVHSQEKILLTALEDLESAKLEDLFQDPLLEHFKQQITLSPDVNKMKAAIQNLQMRGSNYDQAQFVLKMFLEIAEKNLEGRSFSEVFEIFFQKLRNMPHNSTNLLKALTPAMLNSLSIKLEKAPQDIHLQRLMYDILKLKFTELETEDLTRYVLPTPKLLLAAFNKVRFPENDPWRQSRVKIGAYDQILYKGLLRASSTFADESILTNKRQAADMKRLVTHLFQYFLKYFSPNGPVNFKDSITKDVLLIETEGLNLVEEKPENFYSDLQEILESLEEVKDLHSLDWSKCLEKVKELNQWINL